MPPLKNRGGIFLPILFCVRDRLLNCRGHLFKAVGISRKAVSIPKLKYQAELTA